MYSTHNEEKFVVAKRFVTTLIIKIYKYMTIISKNVYMDKLDDIVNKYNNTYHRIFKIKSIDVKWSIYIDFNKVNNKEGTKFKVDDHIRISNIKIFLQKTIYVTNWSEEVFVIRIVKAH